MAEIITWIPTKVEYVYLLISGHRSTDGKSTDPLSPTSSHEVSFTPTLVEVEIDNTHPVTQAFTSEMFKCVCNRNNE